MSKVILIRGLPGSGKSTMARELAEQGFEHHEADQYFLNAEGKYVFSAKELPAAHSQCLSRAKGSMARGKDCVVSNTFVRYWEMQPYFDAAVAVGCHVIVIEANGQFENCHGVPVDVIARMKDRWEPYHGVSFNHIKEMK